MTDSIKKKDGKGLDEKLPGVLSLTRRTSVTDGIFYSVLADGSLEPIHVRRGGLRGLKNVNKATQEADVGNVQQTDYAKTSPDAVGAAVKFAITFQPLLAGLNSMASSKGDSSTILIDFKSAFEGFIGKATDGGNISAGLLEVATRYARNIANGRWLWRNRQFSQSLTVNVKCGDEQLAFNGLKIPLNNFSNYSDDEKKLGKIIALQLAGEINDSIEVDARLDFGSSMAQSVEVFPSQNYPGTDKPKGFARSLYAVGQSSLKRSTDLLEFELDQSVGIAALRDTKIGNAIRTIDTWYDSNTGDENPVPVEPNGANLETQTYLRSRNTSSFVIARKMATLDTDSEEGMFMLASLVRGGVYSEGGA